MTIKCPEPKKPLNARLLLMAVAMTASVVSHAFAAMPKSESVITRDQVTLSDVFDGVTENADYVLAPAPDMGRTLTLNVNDLNRISEAFNLGWHASAPQQTVIRRSVNVIGSADIKDALVRSLKEKLSGQRVDLDLADANATLKVSGETAALPSVQELHVDAAHNSFTAVVAAGDAHRDVSGTYYSITQLPVLKTPLRPGDVIAKSDIDFIDVRSTDISAAMIVDTGHLVGQTPKRGLSAFKPLTASDVTAPMVIKKGDLVTMTLKSDILMLTTQGRAMEDGAAGDVVKVMNTASKQTLDAVVTGPQAVDVRAL